MSVEKVLFNYKFRFGFHGKSSTKIYSIFTFECKLNYTHFAVTSISMNIRKLITAIDTIL